MIERSVKNLYRFINILVLWDSLPIKNLSKCLASDKPIGCTYEP